MEAYNALAWHVDIKKNFIRLVVQILKIMFYLHDI